MISHIIRFTIIQMPPPILRWDSPRTRAVRFADFVSCPRSGGSLC